MNTHSNLMNTHSNIIKRTIDNKEHKLFQWNFISAYLNWITVTIVDTQLHSCGLSINFDQLGDDLTQVRDVPATLLGGHPLPPEHLDALDQLVLGVRLVFISQPLFKLVPYHFCKTNKNING